MKRTPVLVVGRKGGIPTALLPAASEKLGLGLVLNPLGCTPQPMQMVLV
jgi:hypothetical protein